MTMLRVTHLQPIEMRLELSCGPKMTDREIAHFVSVYQRENPDRLCVFNGTTREIYSRGRDVNVSEI